MDIQKLTSEQQLSKWAELIQSRLESGQSIKEFCLINGISKATYYYWQKKVSKAKCTVLGGEKESKTEVPSGWMQLAPKPAHSAKATLEIKINGCNVAVNTETDLELLKKVCQVLMSL
jgi:putative transposase